MMGIVYQGGLYVWIYESGCGQVDERLTRGRLRCIWLGWGGLRKEEAETTVNYYCFLGLCCKGVLRDVFEWPETLQMFYSAYCVSDFFSPQRSTSAFYGFRAVEESSEISSHGFLALLCVLFCPHSAEYGAVCKA